MRVSVGMRRGLVISHAVQRDWRELSDVHEIQIIMCGSVNSGPHKKGGEGEEVGRVVRALFAYLHAPSMPPGILVLFSKFECVCTDFGFGHEDGFLKYTQQAFLYASAGLPTVPYLTVQYRIFMWYCTVLKMHIFWGL